MKAFRSTKNGMIEIKIKYVFEYHGFKFFAHKKDCDFYEWYVSEWNSGFIVSGGFTQKEAVDKCKYTINLKGHEETQKMVNKAITEFGVANKNYK